MSSTNQPHPASECISAAGMSYAEARCIIWVPDAHPLENVAEAALRVLETRGAAPEDAHQAAHLITTFRP